MDGRNMAGMTGGEIEAGLKRQERGCLVAAACVLALAVIALGWLVYLACNRWPVVVGALDGVGKGMLGLAAAAVFFAGFSWSIDVTEE